MQKEITDLCMHGVFFRTPHSLSRFRHTLQSRKIWLFVHVLQKLFMFNIPVRFLVNIYFKYCLYTAHTKSVVQLTSSY